MDFSSSFRSMPLKPVASICTWSAAAANSASPGKAATCGCRSSQPCANPACRSASSCGRTDSITGSLCTGASISTVFFVGSVWMRGLSRDSGDSLTKASRGPSSASSPSEVRLAQDGIVVDLRQELEIARQAQLDFLGHAELIGGNAFPAVEQGFATRKGWGLFALCDRLVGVIRVPLRRGARRRVRRRTPRVPPCPLAG
jgi:hypothetical protein